MTTSHEFSPEEKVRLLRALKAELNHLRNESMKSAPSFVHQAYGVEILSVAKLITDLGGKP